MSTPPRLAGRLAVACAAGGAVGSLLRLTVSALANPDQVGDGFPWGTLAVNLLGSLVLAQLARRPMPLASAAFWRTGVLGAFTTFSAFSAEAVLLADRHQVQALAYVVISLAGGLLAVRVAITDRRRS